MSPVMIDVRTALDLVVMVATPIFAAGGAWASIRHLRAEVKEIKRDVERLDRRVVNLYLHLRAPLPVEIEDSIN